MDIVSAEKRSDMMSQVKSKNTKPELTVRKLVYGLGYRYRLHRKDLPGKPDMAFIGLKKVIFVNGCFWHGHEGCSKATIPKTRSKFWRAKIEGNKLRDARSIKELAELGWESLVIWECELAKLDNISRTIRQFLGERS